jgi:hypothetical protein
MKNEFAVNAMDSVGVSEKQTSLTCQNMSYLITSKKTQSIFDLPVLLAKKILQC